MSHVKNHHDPNVRVRTTGVRLTIRGAHRFDQLLRKGNANRKTGRSFITGLPEGERIEVVILQAASGPGFTNDSKITSAVGKRLKVKSALAKGFIRELISQGKLSRIG